MTSPARRTALESELRARGLPLVLPAHVRRRRLLARAAPYLLAWALVVLGLSMSSTALATLERMDERGDDLFSAEGTLLAFTLGSLVLTLSPFVAGLAQLVLRRTERYATVVGVLAVALTLGVSRLPGVEPAVDPLVRLVGIALGLLATYLGLGPMTAWAVRRISGQLSQVGPMVSRVLPLLLLSFLFLFFNAEIWQVAAHLSAGRTWGAAAVLLLFGAALAAANIGDGLRDVVGVTAEESPLRRSERVNVLVVGVLLTLIQALVFGAVVLAFFVGFGALSITPDTAQAWIGRPATSLGPVADELGISWTLVQVSLILASLAALSLIASAGSDPAYRARFIDPTLEELREGLRVREEYRRIGEEEPAPATP